MIRLMIGRDLRPLYIPLDAAPPEGGCEISGVVTAAFPRQQVNLAIRKGEILGLAGLVGAGRTSLARALFGIDRILGGEVRLDGTGVDITSPRQAMRRGIYLVPEDRKRSGLILEMPVVENIALANLGAYARMSLVQRDQEVAVSSTQRKRLSVGALGDQTQVVTLSGGNQQKVVLAEWLSMQPKVVIFDEPTRGVDVGAKNEIYGLMRDLADRGVAILMISLDMEEVIGVSDRIAVMHEGSISGVLERPRFSDHNVLRLAIGLRFTVDVRQFIRAVCDPSRRTGWLRPPRKRGFDPGHRARHRVASGTAEPRRHPGHSQFAEFRGDGNRNTAGRVRRSATAETAGGGDCRCRGAERWGPPLPYADQAEPKNSADVWCNIGLIQIARQTPGGSNCPVNASNMKTF